MMMLVRFPLQMNHEICSRWWGARLGMLLAFWAVRAQTASAKTRAIGALRLKTHVKTTEPDTPEV